MALKGFYEAAEFADCALTPRHEGLHEAEVMLYNRPAWRFHFGRHDRVVDELRELQMRAFE